MTGPGLTGLAIAVGTLALAGVLGLLWQRGQGRVRAGAGAGGGPVEQALPAAVLGKVDPDVAVTLLQLSAPVCARCTQARVVLGELSTVTEGVRHAELDLSEHPDLPGRLGVRSTPTTLAISAAGRELFRVAGVPRRAALLSALEPHL